MLAKVLPNNFWRKTEDYVKKEAAIHTQLKKILCVDSPELIRLSQNQLVSLRVPNSDRGTGVLRFRPLAGYPSGGINALFTD